MLDINLLKRMLPVVNSSNWEIFQEYLDYHLNLTHKQLYNSKDNELYVAQGKAKLLLELKELRSTINANVRGLKHG